MRWLRAIVLLLPDPDAAVKLFTEAFEFSVEEQPDGRRRLENGAISLVVGHGEGPPYELEVSCDDAAAEGQRLLVLEGVSAAGPITRKDHCIEQRLLCACGVVLMLNQTLDEDDRDELLPLPTSLEWEETVDVCVRRMLRWVPIAFRAKARERVTVSAEYLAVEAGLLCVEESHAMRGFVSSTLDFQHRSLAEAMVKEGVDPSLYLPLFPDIK